MTEISWKVAQEFTEEEIKAAIRKATIACEMNPVFCGTAYRNKGVQPVIDAVIDYLPAPTDIPAIKGVLPRRRLKLKDTHLMMNHSQL